MKPIEPSEPTQLMLRETNFAWLRRQVRDNPVAYLSLLVSCIAILGPGLNAICSLLQMRYSSQAAIVDRKERDLEFLYGSIEQAELYACIARSSRVGSHTFTMYLELARSAEERNRDEAPVFVYHALADLGNQVFGFDLIKRYCELALQKSADEIDRSLSLQQLASVHFDFHEFAGTDASLATARDNFAKAILELESMPMGRARGVPRPF